MADIGILGSGTWGTALARMLTNSAHAVTVWSPHSVESLQKERKHKNLPGVLIPEETAFTLSMEEACAGKEIILVVVPSVFVRSTVASAVPFLRPGQIIVSASKGIEEGTLLTMTQVIADELRKGGKEKGISLVALSGPTHAEEVALDLPSTIVSASEDRAAAERVQEVFMNTCMRVYTNDDVYGVELCGAVKNIVAIAAGIAAGLGYGDNTRAALVTRGMAEIKRLGVTLGCREQTFSGLAGIGDLVVTATSQHSRNNRCGYLIGRGLSTQEAVKEIGMVVEGLNALSAAMELSRQKGVEMPITRAVYDIVVRGEEPRQVVLGLMTRDRRSEVESL